MRLPTTSRARPRGPVPSRRWWGATGHVATLGLAGLLAVSACSGSPKASTAASVSPARSSSSAGPNGAGTARPGAAVDLATGLKSPWGLAFLPDGSALVSERDTALIKRVSADGQVSEVGEVAGVVPGGEGGLLGLALSPTYARDQLVYAYLTAADDNRIVRMTYDGTRLGAPQVIFSGIAKAANHDGGRLAFGPDGKLYVGTGDANDRPAAQDVSSPNGKILRLEPDGSIPTDNPWPGKPAWSIGHRNVQGLVFDETGRLWAAEFGQDTWDELNLIAKGDNDGWPTVEGKAGKAGFVDPVAQWATDDASPSGVGYADGVVLMAALRGQRLWAIPVPGGIAGTPQPFYAGRYGRLRTVAAAPDGSFWLMTSNTDGRGSAKTGDDRILKVTLR